MGHDTCVEVDHVNWFAGHGPKDPIGPCPHTCPHNAGSVIAWGPSHRHYELVQCDVDEGCAGRCRAWEAATPTSRGGIPNSHPWLQVTPDPSDLVVITSTEYLEISGIPPAHTGVEGAQPRISGA